MARHDRLKTLFLACCELQPGARADLLDRECAGDAGLRSELQAMLDFDSRRPGDRGLGLSLREPPALPERIGPFRVLRLIGEGGMGSVYEVEQDRPRRRVALKLLHPGQPLGSVVRRLEREGELLGRLQHPGIARIYESGQIATPFGPQPYLVMELVSGEPLTRWARSQRASPRARLELLARVCDAVQHAHEQGVIHRDLKPGNVLVEPDGAPRVLDFGIARALDADPLGTLNTRAGEIVGTLAYMSPEQAGGDARRLDARTDVYSLGVLLHELLSGELPIAIGEHSLTDAVKLIRNGEPRRLGELQRDWRGDVETIALKALEKDPARRYATAAALAADIRRHLAEQPVEARPPSRVYRVRKYVRRNRLPVVAGAAVLAVSVAGLLVALRFASGEAQERQRATESDAEARAVSYQSGLLVAQRLIEEGGFAAARTQLTALPEELRSGDWSLLDRRLERQLAQLELPGVWDAVCLDEARVLAVDADTHRTLWDPIAGTTTALGAAVPGARPLALTRDGRWLLAFSEAERACFLGAAAGPAGGTRLDLPPELLTGADGAVRPFAAHWRSSTVCDDGSRCALAFADGSVWLVDVPGAPRWRQLVAPGAVPCTLVFSPGGGHRLAVGGPKALRLYDCDEPRLLWRSRSDDTTFFALSFDDAGHLIFSLGGGLQVADVETGKLLQDQTANALRMQHVGQTFDIARIATDGEAPVADVQLGQVALMLQDGTTSIVDVASGQLRGDFTHKGVWQTSLAAAPQGTMLLSCNRRDGTLRLWSTEPQTSEVLGSIEEAVYPLAVSPDGLLVATGAWDGMARLWEIPGSRAVAALPNHCKRVEALAFSPDGRTLACGLGVEGLSTWDLRSGRPLLRRDDLKAGAVAWSPDGSRLACGDGTGVVLLDPATLQARSELRPIGNYTVSLAWSPDGQLLAAGSRDGVLSVRDAASGAELSRVVGSRSGTWEWTGVRALSFSPDGTQLASGWGSGELIVYDAPRCAAPRVLAGHRNEIFGLAWSPDGRRLASGGRDRQLRLWNPEMASLMLSLSGHEDYIFGVAFTPDGRRLVTSSGDHTVRLWDTGPAALRWKERARAGRERVALQPLVDDELAEVRDPATVADRLRARPELDAEQRRIALDLLLESQAAR